MYDGAARVAPICIIFFVNGIHIKCHESVYICTPTHTCGIISTVEVEKNMTSSIKHLLGHYRIVHNII